MASLGRLTAPHTLGFCSDSTHPIPTIPDLLLLHSVPRAQDPAIFLGSSSQISHQSQQPIDSVLQMLPNRPEAQQRLKTLNFLLIGRFCLQAVTVYELYNSEKVTKPPFGSFFLSEKFGIIVVHSP